MDIMRLKKIELLDPSFDSKTLGADCMNQFLGIFFCSRVSPAKIQKYKSIFSLPLVVSNHAHVSGFICPRIEISEVVGWRQKSLDCLISKSEHIKPKVFI